MQKTLFFDIETGPLPEDELRPLMPEFTAPANYKDPEKIKVNIAEQEAKWLANGALSAVTGKVIVIGCLLDGTMNLWPAGASATDEAELLKAWWGFMAEEIQAGNDFVGFCCKSFDVPFLMRRSWKHQVPVPACLWEGRYLSSQIVDVAERWGCGNRDSRDAISLDNLSKFLGIGQKCGDGKDFAALWDSDRQMATNYLRTDLELIHKAYARMGYVYP